MTVKPPAGDEAFYFVATREPMSFLSDSDILAETAGIASLDLSPAPVLPEPGRWRGDEPIPMTGAA